ncbi:MAG: T9SS type A sorting domain-containing protein [Ferruginibacter sp.]|nr:T9SS type A sorting domain-containing protein [Ferruginibacter sp.]
MNLSHYEVERSVDGVNFSTRGEVKVKLAADQNVYDYIDDISMVTSPEIYYRLKAIDRNGRFKFSNIVSVKPSVITDIQCYPNPFVSEINININSKTNDRAKLSLFTAEGKLVAQQQHKLSLGINKIVLKNLIKLDAQNYILTIETPSGKESIKLLKRH